MLGQAEHSGTTAGRRPGKPECPGHKPGLVGNSQHLVEGKPVRVERNRHPVAGKPGLVGRIQRPVVGKQEPVGHSQHLVEDKPARVGRIQRPVEDKPEPVERSQHPVGDSQRHRRERLRSLGQTGQPRRLAVGERKTLRRRKLGLERLRRLVRLPERHHRLVEEPLRRLAVEARTPAVEGLRHKTAAEERMRMQLERFRSSERELDRKRALLALLRRRERQELRHKTAVVVGKPEREQPRKVELEGRKTMRRHRKLERVPHKEPVQRERKRREPEPIQRKMIQRRRQEPVVRMTGRTKELAGRIAVPVGEQRG